MNLDLAPGKYVIAVSGGVDSMVLLDMLAHQPDLALTVAHFDHGIRDDSHIDRQLVEQRAAELGLPFIYERVELGRNTGEEQAREERYAFLERARQQVGAQAIITAHHQDDVVETMLINIRRGTGRRGLSSLRTTETKVRPLLGYTKNELQKYAKEQGITWREDSTNSDSRYARNHLRQHVLPYMSAESRVRLLDIQQRMQQLNREIDDQIREVLQIVIDENNGIVRKKFVMLPHDVSLEAVAALLRRHKVHNMSRKQVVRLVVAIKTARPHATYDIDGSWILAVSAQTANIMQRSARKNS